jgi:hypothetical protein
LVTGVAVQQGQGIGIEVWRPGPADWNRRVHALGNGAWAGGTDIASSDVIGALYAAAIAATEASVTAQTDTGHSDPPMLAAGQLFTALTDRVDEGGRACRRRRSHTGRARTPAFAQAPAGAADNRPTTVGRCHTVFDQIPVDEGDEEQKLGCRTMGTVYTVS